MIFAVKKGILTDCLAHAYVESYHDESIRYHGLASVDCLTKGDYRRDWEIGDLEREEHLGFARKQLWSRYPSLAK